MICIGDNIKYMNNNMIFGFGPLFQGFYKISVVDATTDEVKWESDWNKNLILNQGMNELPQRLVCNVFTVALAGTGSRPNSISGGTSTITQSGATIRLAPIAGLLDFTSSVMSASHVYYSASAQVGDMIVYSSTESMITEVDSNGINLTLNTSYSFSDERTFTIYKTSQRGLQGEVKRYGSYLTGVGNCGTTSSSYSNYTFRRTYDFLSESILRTYTEVGTSWSATQTGSNVFSRIVLPTPVDVDVGFKLRMVYDLQVTISPATPVYFTASISGWPHPLGTATSTIATQSIQMPFMSAVNTIGGQSAVGGNYNILDPASIAGSSPGNFNLFASSNSQSLASIGSAVDRGNDAEYLVSNTTSSYIINSFYIDKTGVFIEEVLNIPNIRSIGVGGVPGGGSYSPWLATRQGFCVLFNEPQLKLDTQQLSITFRSSWGRVLS